MWEERLPDEWGADRPGILDVYFFPTFRYSVQGRSAANNDKREKQACRVGSLGWEHRSIWTLEP